MALIASKLSSLVPFTSCALFLYDEEGETLRCRFATGAEADVIGTMTVRSGQGLTGWVARNRRPLVNARPSADFEAAGLTGTRHDPAVGAGRAAGLQRSLHRHARGVSRRSRTSTPTITAACSIACPSRPSAVIHNSIVFEQTQEDSLTDPLTGLPNTRFMFMHLTRELARAERLKSEVALLVMDLDNFKDINDSHGHHIGDRALREVAPVLRSAIRPYDICVRYAGDEFIVVLSGCGQEEAERKRVELQRTVDRSRVRSAPGPPDSARRSASAPRSTRRTARPTRRCSRRPTAACIATRRAASSSRGCSRCATGTDGRALHRPGDRCRSSRPRSKFSAPASASCRIAVRGHRAFSVCT